MGFPAHYILSFIFETFTVPWVKFDKIIDFRRFNEYCMCNLVMKCSGDFQSLRPLENDDWAKILCKQNVFDLAWIWTCNPRTWNEHSTVCYPALGNTRYFVLFCSTKFCFNTFSKKCVSINILKSTNFSRKKHCKQLFHEVYYVKKVVK